MTSPALSATAEASRDTLQAALDVFNGPDSTRLPEGLRQRLNDLVEKHKQAAAKAVLLVSGSGSSTSSSGAGTGAGGSGGPAVVRPEELRAVISALEQSAIALVSHSHGFTACAGPSLKQSLKQLCTAVIKPTQELVEQLLRNGGAEGPRKAFGLVWGGCDELARGPLDNKTCLFRQLAEVMQAIKGAAKELDELCEVSRKELESGAGTATAGPTRGSCNGNGIYSAICGSGAAVAIAAASAEELSGRGRSRDQGGDEDGGGGCQLGRELEGQDSLGAEGEAARHEGVNEDHDEEGAEEEDDDEEEEEEDDYDDFRGMGALSGQELSTAEAAAALLGAAQAALRLISRPLLEAPVVSSDHSLEEWESLAWHAARLRSACEGLVACLYPPHDELDELQGQVEAVSNTLELMLSELPSEYFGGEEGEGEGEVQWEGEGEGERTQQQRLQQQAEVVRREVETAVGRLTDELSRQGRPAGGA
ncbi:hypothetical protein VaNZ11_016879 [Volvox africanus]|uniref:Cyclin-D1-binding protein 1-like N-terminal domain-containing protein n=1 Tax=Volvox africanus TaxID=51714 RepID=A0ABQ5SQE9_9CHLO|nr:hypothetical protein VaNZ11_016879 [Volvox africanus]